MQYRIPLQNEGFVFRVSMERNPDRKCNFFRQIGDGQKYFSESIIHFFKGLDSLVSPLRSFIEMAAAKKIKSRLQSSS